MEAAAQLFSSPFLSRQPVSLNQSRRKRRKSHVQVAVRARKDVGDNGRDYWGNIVDQNMIVLRKRIREMKMVEEGFDQEVNSNWMQWEKAYYVHYNQDVCEAMGLLQNYFMNIRPSLALGTLVLVTFSVLISSGVVLFHALEIAKGIISGLHLN